MKVTTDNIYTVLKSNLVPGKVISWTDMMVIVQAHGMKVKNWMQVRGVLQFMLNEQMLSRTDNLYKEEYLCGDLS